MSDEAYPYEWNKVSQVFYAIISEFGQPEDNILEFGCATGHISFRLAVDGYNVSLLDIRPEVISIAENIFKSYGLQAEFFCQDILDHTASYDLAWNSGLIQCLEDAQKIRIIKHIRSISKRILLFYPDTDSSKSKGENLSQIPGVSDAKEYSVKNVPLIVSSFYQNLLCGELKAEAIDMPFSMIWLYGETR